MATMNVKDAAGSTVSVEKPLTPGRAAATASRPIVLATEDKAALDGVATQTTLAAVLAKLTSDPATQTTLAEILTALAGTLTVGLPSGAATSANQTSANTKLDTLHTDLDGVEGSLASILSAVAGTLTVGLPTGASTAANQTTGNTSLASILTAVTAATPAGTNNIGDVDVLTLPALPAGSNTIGSVVGTAAHDAADSGAPIKMGGRARSSEIAAVANDDRADFVTDLAGKQIVLPYANPENFVSGAITTAMTGTTSTSLVAAPGSGLRNYITAVIVSNSHATVGTDVVIQDGSGGTTLMTIPAAAVYGGAIITLPTPLRQPTANTALFCANVTTGSSTKVSAVGYKGV